MSYELPEEKREEFIEENIVSEFDEEKKDEIEEKVEDLVAKYQGFDVDALSILAYASERDQFDEYYERLGKLYAKDVQYIHPEQRKLRVGKSVLRVQISMKDMYEDLGIEPRE